MARIDQHIMDDADLAGPFLFCALFGTFLLLVKLTVVVRRLSPSLTIHSPESSGLAMYAD